MKGVCIDMIIDFIEEHFSGYSMILILLAAWMLIFVDRGQLKRKGLKREAFFSLAAGVVYAFIAAVSFLIGFIASTR